MIADAYRELRKDFPQLALTIAPRHLERTPEVENALRAASLDYVKASELNSPNAARDADVLILDTMGDLRSFYRRARSRSSAAASRLDAAGKILRSPRWSMSRC